MSWLKRSLLLLFFSFGGPGGLVFGQANSVSGEVRDQAGTPVPGATVELRAPRSDAAALTTLSDEQGHFAFVSVPDGEYVCTVSLTGFHTFQKTFRLTGGAQESLPIALETELPPMSVSVEAYAAAPRTASSSSSYRQEEFSERPLETPADVLRAVPGLIIAQHAGGAKSDQYLIRGFDADHGTDIALYYEGIPVNMVSHAHGQGYADLHWMIPETLVAMDAYKGPYFAEFGNLATGAAVQMRMREDFERSFARFQGGRFDNQRVLIGLSPRFSAGKGLIAIEASHNDGPFRNPQRLRRLNLATRFSFPVGDRQAFWVLFTGYEGNWNASGQIPLREVRAGRLDRFGSIDPSEGGDSSRYNFSVGHRKVWGSQVLKSQFYLVHYDLRLFTNFTFFARDSLHGDGILQTDDRKVLGGHVQYHRAHRLLGRSSMLTLGVDYRQDLADVGLFYQEKRRLLSTAVSSHINELNAALYVQEEVPFSDSLKSIVGFRYDGFRFGVEDRMGKDPASAPTRSFVGPKASLVYTPAKGDSLQFFLNYGRGFHSNDARAVAADPRGVALPAASGYELGLNRKFMNRMEVTFAYWLLDLKGELVWLGDEGTTELSGPTRRHGPELEIKYRIRDDLWADADFTYSRGFFRGTREAIARAPRFTASGGFSYRPAEALSASLRLRHVGDHPIVEDASAFAEGYTVADLTLRRRLGRDWEALVSVENLFNADFKEAQTYFASRLKHEPQPVPDNHFNAGVPFAWKVGLQYHFDF